jgi:phosphoesterase RecJ-like protein
VYDAIYRGRSPAELDLFARVVSSRRMGARGALAWASLSRKMMRQAGFVPAETQEYLEALKSLAGVRMALLLREEPGGRKVKVSVRTDPGVDGTRFVRRWGGGGHPRAAGATFRGTLAQAQRTVVREAERFLDGARSGNA